MGSVGPGRKSPRLAQEHRNWWIGMGGARVGPEIVASRARRREGRDSGYAWASLDTLGRVGCYRARGLAGSG